MPAVDARWRRIATHEWTAATLGSVVLAVAMVWILPPMLLHFLSRGTVNNGFADPAETIIGDAADPTGQSWLLAWVGHALLRAPGRLWDTNAFYPDTGGLALNDSMLGYAPAGFFGEGVQAAVIRYNVLFVLVFALAFLGTYALIRQLGANRVGAALAGAAFAYAPWRYGHDGHLNILSTGAIPLALAMLARGHGYSLRHGYRPERVRPGWAVAGWLTAAWQLLIGFGVGLPFFYVLAGVCLAGLVAWFVTGRPPLPRRLLISDLAGGLAFAAVAGLMALQYLRVRDNHPETLRSLDYVGVFSPPLKGYLVAPRTSLPWGTWHDGARAALEPATNEKALLCGIVLYALAIGGLLFSIWTVRQRVFMAVGIVVGVVLSLGTNTPAFELLYNHLPGFDGSRTPGRLVLWPTLLMAVLAAGLVTRLASRIRAVTLAEARPLAVRVVTVPLLLLVLAEGMPKMDHVPVPQAPAAMAVAPGPMVVLPSDEGTDLNVMLWSTDGFPTVTNGTASVVTPVRQEVRDLMTTFPSPGSVARLRELGIRSVVVVRERVHNTPYVNTLTAPVDGLGITREEIGLDVVFRLDQ